MLAFCRALPKIELHAHINGCIRDETLNELCRACDDPEVQMFCVSPLYSSCQPVPRFVLVRVCAEKDGLCLLLGLLICCHVQSKYYRLAPGPALFLSLSTHLSRLVLGCALGTTG